MRLSVISLATLVVTVCNAAPIYWDLPIEDREYLAPLEVREDDFEELFARAAPNPGPYPLPGMQHRDESNPPVTAFNPIPPRTYFQTPSNRYNADTVNQAATDMMQHVSNAPPYRSKTAAKLKSYPKPSTGFRPNEPQNPAPNDGQHVAYHSPIGGPPQYTIGPQGSARVGPDRVVAHRRLSEGAHNIGISYHDPRNPVPPARPGGLQSNNHPFSMATPRHSPTPGHSPEPVIPQPRPGPIQRFKTAVKKVFAKMKPKPKPQRRNSI
jgi:hypothetical protein